MATTSPAASINRPARATGAAVVLGLSAIVDFVFLGAYLSGAPIPPVAVGMWVALGVAGLVTAGGLRAGRRWAAPLAIALAAITVLLGVVGFLSSSSSTGKVVAGANVILALAAIALVAPLAKRRAAA